MKQRPTYRIQFIKAKGIYLVIDHRGLHHRTCASEAQARRVVAQLIEQRTNTNPQEK